ncbi:MAG TPA: hypothetical protein DIU45_15110 [Clostridium sp.]|nr:hypothetical protein [Clostridium sp.]
MIICTYKFANIIIIIMSLIMDELNSAINWGIILAGNRIWFGAFDVMEPKEKGNKKLYTLTYHDAITYSILLLCTIPIIISLKYEFVLITNILIGIAYGLIIVGIIVFIPYIILLVKRKFF